MHPGRYIYIYIMLLPHKLLLQLLEHWEHDDPLVYGLFISELPLQIGKKSVADYSLRGQEPRIKMPDRKLDLMLAGNANKPLFSK